MSIREKSARLKNKTFREMQLARILAGCVVIVLSLTFFGCSNRTDGVVTASPPCLRALPEPAGRSHSSMR